KDLLARLTQTDRAKLPAPPVVLTREAERYYRHAVPLENNVQLWRWDEKAGQPVQGLPGAPVVSPSLAEAYFGLRCDHHAWAVARLSGSPRPVRGRRSVAAHPGRAAGERRRSRRGCAAPLCRYRPATEGPPAGDAARLP